MNPNQYNGAPVYPPEMDQQHMPNPAPQAIDAPQPVQPMYPSENVPMSQIAPPMGAAQYPMQPVQQMQPMPPMQPMYGQQMGTPDQQVPMYPNQAPYPGQQGQPIYPTQPMYQQPATTNVVVIEKPASSNTDAEDACCCIVATCMICHCIMEFLECLLCLCH